MAQTKDNKTESKQDNFYTLLKEILETQIETLKIVKEIQSQGGNKEKDIAKMWEGM